MTTTFTTLLWSLLNSATLFAIFQINEDIITRLLYFHSRFKLIYMIFRWYIDTFYRISLVQYNKLQIFLVHGKKGVTIKKVIYSRWITINSKTLYSSDMFTQIFMTTCNLFSCLRRFIHGH